MFYHELRTSDNNRKAKEILLEQERNLYVNKTVYGKVIRILNDLGISKSEVITSKSIWKKKCKDKIIQKIRERIKTETEGKTKARFMQTDKWERK